MRFVWLVLRLVWSSWLFVWVCVGVVGALDQLCCFWWFVFFVFCEYLDFDCV